MKNQDIDVDNIVIRKSCKTKTNSKFSIGYLVDVIRPLVLILPKMSEYTKNLKIKDKKNN